jgi:hypothetical protein
MSHDDSFEAAVREYLAGAQRALERGDATSASIEIVRALQYSFAIVRRHPYSDPRYRESWESVADEMSKLPPSLLRQAMRIVDGRSGMTG